MTKRAKRTSIHQARRTRRFDIHLAAPATSEIAREVNRDVILQVIRHHPSITQADLSRSLNLSPSSLAAIVEQLVREGWVRRTTIRKPLRGRPTSSLALNCDLVVLAVDLQQDGAVVGMVDLEGNCLVRLNIENYSRPSDTAQEIGRRLKSLSREHPTKTFIGVGVAQSGAAHSNTSSRRRLRDRNLKEALEDVCKLQVEVENDANVCLLSELWSGRLEGAKNVVLLSVEDGIRAAILTGDQLHYGQNGTAGEFGHISLDPRGLACRCGQRGCWETVASSPAALRAHNRKSRRQIKDIDELFDRCANGDRAAIRAVTDQARFLGRGLRVITAMLSPELILVVGKITASWDHLGPIIEKELAAAMLAGHPPALRPAGNPELSRLIGSAVLVVTRYASPKQVSARA